MSPGAKKIASTMMSMVFDDLENRMGIEIPADARRPFIKELATGIKGTFEQLSGSLVETDKTPTVPWHRRLAPDLPLSHRWDSFL